MRVGRELAFRMGQVHLVEHFERDGTGFLFAHFAALLRDDGVDQLRADLEEIGATMTAEWLESTGDQGQAIVDAYGASE